MEKRTVPCGVLVGGLAVEEITALIGKKSSVAAGWGEKCSVSLTGSLILSLSFPLLYSLLLLSLFFFFSFFCFASLHADIYYTSLCPSSLHVFNSQVSLEGHPRRFFLPCRVCVCLRAWWFRVSPLRMIRSLWLLGHIYIYKMDIFMLFSHSSSHKCPCQEHTSLCGFITNVDISESIRCKNADIGRSYKKILTSTANFVPQFVCMAMISLGEDRGHAGLWWDVNSVLWGFQHFLRQKKSYWYKCDLSVKAIEQENRHCAKKTKFGIFTINCKIKWYFMLLPEPYKLFKHPLC